MLLAGNDSFHAYSAKTSADLKFCRLIFLLGLFVLFLYLFVVVCLFCFGGIV